MVVIMPLPTPKDGQDKNEWMQFCMSNETMKQEYPDTKQRIAICYSQWRNKNKSDDEITKCVKCGLKDATGYFCRFNDGQKFYYDTNDAESKKLAKIKAEEFGMDMTVLGILKAFDEEQQIKEMPKPSGGADEEPREDEPGREEILSYIVPKSKDELKLGDIIKYNGKIGIIKKVIN